MNTSVNKPVVAIGNFDGVHRGHAALLAAGKRIAAFENRKLVVLTFEPHPRSFFKPQDPPFRITPEGVKERRLTALGVDHVDVLDFNAVMANLTPEQFIDMVIVGHADAAHVVVGADFHFGKGRAGTVETLRTDGRFNVDGVALEILADEPVSSTRIRAALQRGDIAAANAMLGWEWEMEGQVVRGDARGRELGYPTANIPLGDAMPPAYGIYAVRVLIDGVWRDAVASIGIRPMFQLKAPLLEVYVFDFDGDLYGRSLRVRPVKKLRDEARFDGIEPLKAQMNRDVADAKAALAA